MSETKDIVYFELSDQFAGRDYPFEKPFIGWMINGDNSFEDKSFVEENKLCVVCSVIDMHMNYCITAKREWVESNCPNLLVKYTRFLRTPNENGEVYGIHGNKFKEYTKDNINIFYQDLENGVITKETEYKDTNNRKSQAKPKKVVKRAKSPVVKKAQPKTDKSIKKPKTRNHKMT